MSAEDCDVMVNILLVGEYGVGKTCLMHKFVDDNFLECAASSTSLDFKVKKFTYKNKAVRINVWDTAGKEKLQSSLSYTYYRGANGVILAFDATNRKSFNAVPKWMETIEKNCNYNIPVALVGLKSDLTGKAEINKEEIDKTMEKYSNILAFFEVSTKDGTNVNEVFVKLLLDILQKNKTGSRRHSERPLPPEIDGNVDVGTCCTIL